MRERVAGVRSEREPGPDRMGPWPPWQGFGFALSEMESHRRVWSQK